MKKWVIIKNVRLELQDIKAYHFSEEKIVTGSTSFKGYFLSIYIKDCPSVINIRFDGKEEVLNKIKELDTWKGPRILEALPSVPQPFLQADGSLSSDRT